MGLCGGNARRAASEMIALVGGAASQGTSLEPMIAVVLAIADGIAPCIMSTRVHGSDRRGDTWALVDGRLNGDALEFSPNGFLQLRLRFKDANSGTLDFLRDGPLIRSGSDRHTRLD